MTSARRFFGFFRGLFAVFAWTFSAFARPIRLSDGDAK